MPPHSPAASSPMPMPPNGVRTVTAGADGHEFVNPNPSRDGRKPEWPGTISLPVPSAGQAVDPRDLLGAEREAEQIQVRRDPLWVGGLRDDRDAVFQVPPQHNL